ncbi:hypothetical protein DL89DRAFT_22018 [Linderina pennispora]|uniref:Uncharacterized protein n=1 Tax=Linderina pennispora TaxID=61395 RepID=A0A1Y1WMF2_9FUNG|nr:uncharacterized protein DL89DRAFT_22018 [Linderina pennispora]ORX74737.1 hypothetical protein DL89DRAFT_22018 [Linderina pennispora]
MPAIPAPAQMAPLLAYRPPYCSSLGMSSGPPPAAFMRSPMASATVTPNYADRTLPPILAAPATAPMTLHRSDVLDSAPLTPTRNPLQHLGSSSPPSSSMVGMSPTYKALFTNAGAGSNRVFGSGSNSDDTAGF